MPTIVMAVLAKRIEDITYAFVRIKIANREMDFDARGSDAIILATIAGTPIFMEKQLLETDGETIDQEEESKG